MNESGYHAMRFGALAQGLNEIAQREGRSVTDVVKAAVAEYLAKNNAGSRGQLVVEDEPRNKEVRCWVTPTTYAVVKEAADREGLPTARLVALLLAKVSRQPGALFPKELEQLEAFKTHLLGLRRLLERQTAATDPKVAAQLAVLRVEIARCTKAIEGLI
jgi:hypothetical protein